MNIKKVILLAPTPPPEGGIARWTTRMLNAKLERDWRIELVDEKVIGGREVFGEESKRKLFLEIKRCMIIWKNLKDKLTDKDIKIVHSCIPAAALSMIREYICACITKRHDRKFIIHFRCTVPNMMKDKFSKFLLKRICEKSDEIIVLNNQSLEYIKSLTGKVPKVIPNFINAKEIIDEKKINERIKRVIYIGGVIEEKGCLDIIKVAEKYNNIEFRLIGKADDKIEKVASEYKNVILTGVKTSEELREELAVADVFMFLSYFIGEGFSNALAEAMASGLPCIVSDWAANSDMIENKGGIVISCKNPKDAIQALKKIENPNIRKKQSEFNINKVKNNYVDSIVLNQYVQLYEDCIKEQECKNKLKREKE